MNDELLRIRRQISAIGHASRFRIVLALCEREWHVSELAREVGLSQSCTTRHLQALTRAQVVHTRRAGKRVMAALTLEQLEVGQVIQWLQSAREASGPGRAQGGVPAGPAQGRRARTTRAEAPAPETPSGSSKEVPPIAEPVSDTPSAPVAARRPKILELDDFLL